MFGDMDRSPQNETNPMRPRGVYGISKLTAFLLMRYYREAHGLHASCGILYNHESPRRSEQFVTGKIVAAAAKIKAGIDKELRLGISIRCAIGRCPRRCRSDVADAPAAHTRRLRDRHRTRTDHSRIAGRGVCDRWTGLAGLRRARQRFYRPAEKCPMIGDASKARTRSGTGQPKREFGEMIREMVMAKLNAYALGTVRAS